MTDPHPLDPLTADEMRHVQALLEREHGVRRPGWRIAAIELVEPAKDVVRAHRPGDEVPRSVRAVLWRTGDGLAFVAHLSLTADAVTAWEPQPGRQPHATVDEWHDCDAAMRAHPEVRAALAGRGITDPELVLVDMWTYGAHLVPERYSGRRIGWCDVWVRASPGGNPYAHPVSGLKLIVDLNAMALLEIDDAGDVGRPPVRGEYDPAVRPDLRLRTDRKPLQVTQPEGVSFTLEGTSCPGSAGNCGSGSPTARVSCCTPSPTTDGRWPTGWRSPRWWCPTATPRPTTTGAPRSTSGSGASAS